ncbi:BRO1 domain-containing protein [Psidium guajava]|nr:BRO1 domain-containing protein [Psidium guajava]
MMLHFPDPAKLKTKKIVFEEVFAALDCGTLEQLKELSSKRRAIEETINATSSITEAIAREMSGGLTSQNQQDLQKLEQYLPLLGNLVFHVDMASSNTQMVRWVSNLRIQWASALTGTLSFLNLMGPKYFQVNDIRFELGMNLFLYGAILRERALEVMPDDLVQSATLFREAAGVYHHLSHGVLSSLQSADSVQRPHEATSSFTTVMSLICLAEAQIVTIMKAEEKRTTAGLLGKLHYGVSEFLDEATCLLNPRTSELKDISARLLEYISSCKALHELRSQKYLAEELRTAGQVGVAIGVLSEALINAKKRSPGEESWKVIVQKEINEAAETLRKLENENEFVWHEKIASGDELPLPQGSRIVKIIPYHPTRSETPLVFKL